MRLRRSGWRPTRSKGSVSRRVLLSFDAAPAPSTRTLPLLAETDPGRATAAIDWIAIGDLEITCSWSPIEHVRAGRNRGMHPDRRGARRRTGLRNRNLVTLNGTGSAAGPDDGNRRTELVLASVKDVQRVGEVGACARFHLVLEEEGGLPGCQIGGVVATAAEKVGAGWIGRRISDRLRSGSCRKAA